MGSALLKSTILIISRINEVYLFSIKYRYSIFFFTTFFVVRCKRLFRCNQTCYFAGMISLTSRSRYQNPWKVNPLYMAEVDSAERADVHADWMHVCFFALYLETV